MILVLPLEEIKELFDKEKEQCQLMGHIHTYKPSYKPAGQTFQGVPVFVDDEKADKVGVCLRCGEEL